MSSSAPPARLRFQVPGCPWSTSRTLCHAIRQTRFSFWRRGRSRDRRRWRRQGTARCRIGDTGRRGCNGRPLFPLIPPSRGFALPDGLRRIARHRNPPRGLGAPAFSRRPRRRGTAPRHSCSRPGSRRGGSFRTGRTRRSRRRLAPASRCLPSGPAGMAPP